MYIYMYIYIYIHDVIFHVSTYVYIYSIYYTYWMFPKPIGTSKHDQSLGGGEWPAQRVPQQRWWVRGVGDPWKVRRLRKHKKGHFEKCLRNFWRMFGECLWMWIIRSDVLEWFSGNLCKNGNLTDKPKQCKWCPDSERIIPRKAYLQGTTTNNSVCFQDAPTRVMHISAKLMLCYWSWLGFQGSCVAPPNVAGRIWENTFPKS